MTELPEEFVDKLPACIGVGGPRVAAGNDHAPNRLGCMGFVFLMGGGIAHASDNEAISDQPSVFSFLRDADN